MQKPGYNNNYSVELLPDIVGINLSSEEVEKLKFYLRYQDKPNMTLFDQIPDIYNMIGGSFENPSRFVLIPYIKDRKEMLTIHKISI